MILFFGVNNFKDSISFLVGNNDYIAIDCTPINGFVVAFVLQILHLRNILPLWIERHYFFCFRNVMSN